MRAYNQDGIPYFQFEHFPENGRLQHAIFTRQGGVSPAPFDSLNLSLSVPDTKENVYKNRRLAYQLFDRRSETVVHAHLVHGTAVARVTHAQNGTWVHHVDGLITDEPGCALVMNYADCTPIFLYDPIHHAIGLGHAGWQGAVQNLPGALVQAMHAAFGSQPADLLAGIGPTIGACCYEVGEPVISAVQNAFPDAWETLLVTPKKPRPFSLGGRPHFDLPEANRLNLLRAGIPESHIHDTGFCTACRTDLFYSHRAERGKTGRFGTILMLGK
ncbi:MAG: peptidoglycan editing factor PgeF [Chloroflexi bacterium]|nr:MAG: peptidoglycan editing factor PgeF [Chloroflexota bacterium]